MLRLKVEPKRKSRDSTIALINIVFLMLIFFLLAGRLSPPLDSAIALALTEQAPPVALPNTIGIRSDGTVMQGGAVTTLENFWQARANQNAESGASLDVKIVVDRALPSSALLDIVSYLRELGAQNVSIITQKSGT